MNDALNHSPHEVIFFTIDPGISAFRIIEKADVVISMPFTSTALSARHMGIPSICYDPSFLVSPNDPASHDIQIIQGHEALADWLKEKTDSLLRVCGRVF